MDKISIIGYYESNFGDLLMLEGIINKLPNSIKVINIFTYGNLNLKNLNLIDSERKINIFSLLNRPVIKTLFKFIVNNWRAKSLTWGGGTCFNDFKGTGGIKWMLVAKLLRCKINYYGVGIDNLSHFTSINRLRLALFISNNFLVRDNISLNIALKYAKESKFKIIEDPILLNNFSTHKYKSDERKIVFSYRNIDEYREDSALIRSNVLIQLVEYLIKLEDFELIIINGDDTVDTSDSDWFYEKLDKKFSDKVQYLRHISFQEKKEIISEANFVITGRLHIGFYAFINEIPFGLYNYSKKNEAFIKENNLSKIHLIFYDRLNETFLEDISLKKVKFNLIKNKTDNFFHLIFN